MILATIIAALIAIPALIFAVECLLGLKPLRKTTGAKGSAPTFAVLVPAHDEAAGITKTVRALRAQIPERSRLLVVADNCTDNTAALARSAGAEVVERSEAGNRGKGYALAFGRDSLTADPPSVVIVIDADCRAVPGSLELIATAAAAGNVAVQAAYLLELPADTKPHVAISTFAFRVRNLVRQRGLARLGAAPLLQGTGMAFPWPMFVEAPLATDDIVEDLNLGIALLRNGHRIVWSEDALVESLPASRDATLAQRTRWEHGFVSSALPGIPRLLCGALRQGRLDMGLLAMDLMVPPLALLVTVTVFAWLLAGLLSVAGSGVPPFVILTGALFALTLAVLLAWFAEGRRMIPLGTLLRAPLYIFWKLPIYGRLVACRETSWVRTARK